MGRNVEHNAAMVEKYIELHALHIGPGSPPDEPMGQKSKGSSRPPATNAAMNFWSTNMEAAKYINWRIAELRNHDAIYRGVSFSGVLTILYGEPAIIRRWKAAEDDPEAATTLQKSLRHYQKRIDRIREAFKRTHGPRRRHADGIISRLEARQEPIERKLWRLREDRKYRDAFVKLCRLVADSIHASNPSVRLQVHSRPQDESVKNKTEARDKDRRITRNDSYRRRYTRYRELEKSMGVDAGDATREAAKAEFSEREGISVPTIERFIRLCEKGEVA